LPRGYEEGHERTIDSHIRNMRRRGPGMMSSHDWADMQHQYHWLDA
jgi:hypothetical protein